MLGGATIRELAGELNERGVRTPGTKDNPEGNAWHPGALRAMLAGPRLAGLRTHRNTVIATSRPDGKAEWPPIISEDEHSRVKAMLDSRSPVGRRGRTPWLLTGLLRCELCGAALCSNTDSASTGGARRYQCRKGTGFHGCGGVRIKAEPVEELLALVATERLANVEARRGADAGPDDSGELAELSRIAAQRIANSDDLAAEQISRETANELRRRPRPPQARTGRLCPQASERQAGPPGSARAPRVPQRPGLDRPGARRAAPRPLRAARPRRHRSRDD